MPPQEQPHKGSRISNTEWGLVIGAAAIIDLIQFVLDFFDVFLVGMISLFVNPFIDLVTGMSLAFYFWMRGVKMDSKKILTFLAGFVGELVPLLNAAPLWTGDVIATMIWDKADKKILSKVPGRNADLNAISNKKNPDVKPRGSNQFTGNRGVDEHEDEINNLKEDAQEWSGVTPPLTSGSYFTENLGPKITVVSPKRKFDLVKPTRDDPERQRSSENHKTTLQDIQVPSKSEPRNDLSGLSDKNPENNIETVSTPELEQDHKQKEGKPLTRNEGISKLYESNPELARIGTQEQYLEHIKNKFPEEIARNLGQEYFQYSINPFVDSSMSVDEEAGRTVSNSEKKRTNEFMKNYITFTTEEDMEKIKPYTGSNYTTINQLLRAGKEINVENILEHNKIESREEHVIEANQRIVDAYHALKANISKSQWATDGSLFNTQKTYRVDFTNYLSNKNIGDVVEDKAFISTSINKGQYARSNFNNDKDVTIIIFNFPKNSVVNAYYTFGVEDELILPPGMSYVIKNKKVIEKNGAKKTILEAEFLPNENIHTIGSKADIDEFRSFVNRSSVDSNSVEGRKAA